MVKHSIEHLYLKNQHVIDCIYQETWVLLSNNKIMLCVSKSLITKTNNFRPKVALVSSLTKILE